MSEDTIGCVVICLKISIFALAETIVAFIFVNNGEL